MAEKLFIDLLKKGEEFIPGRSENLKNKERKKLVKNITCVIDEIGSLAKLANKDDATTSTKSNNESNSKYNSRIKDNRKLKKENDFHKEDDYESAREDDDESIDDEPDKDEEGVFTRFYNYVKEPDNLNQIIEYTRTAITIISAGVAIYSLISKKSNPRIGGATSLAGRRHRRLRNNIPDVTKTFDILRR